MNLIDAEYWSVDQVCEWLDEVGLGYYVTIFQGTLSDKQFMSYTKIVHFTRVPN